MFARLDVSRVFEGMLEVKLPVRFVFLLLGPRDKRNIYMYYQVGRSMATIMSTLVRGIFIQFSVLAKILIMMFGLRNHF